MYAHKNFGSALTRCSAVERGEGGKVVVLHQFPNCSVCEGTVHGICAGDINRANERYESLVAKSNGYLRYGSPVGFWDCHEAGRSVKTRGFLRNAATGAIFAYSDERDDSWKIKKGVLEAIKSNPRPINNSRSSATCDATVPGFQFDPPLDASTRNGGKRCTLVVVTALLGGMDSLNSYKEDREALRNFERKIGLSSCWFAFVDEAVAKRHLESKWKDARSTPQYDTDSGSTIRHFGLWNMVILKKEMVPFRDSETAKNSRIPKMLGHRVFRAANFMLYVDAKLRFRHIENPWYLLHRELVLPKASWVSPRHPARSNAFEEAHCVHLLGLATDRVLDQMRSYEKAGFSASAGGLIEGEWHLRDLRDARSGQLGCDWYKEFIKWGHKRDQTSFPFALWNIQRQDTAPFFRYAPYFESIALFSHVARARQPGSKKRLSSSLCDRNDGSKKKRVGQISDHIASFFRSSV